MDGAKAGRTGELLRHCAPQAKGKIGDMDLQCLKLFLDQLEDAERKSYTIMPL